MPSTFYPRKFIADLDGKALEGTIYVGSENQDPDVNPIPLFWDEALTVPAPQPITISGGYIVNNGTRGELHMAETAWSFRIRNKAGVQIDYAASAPEPVTSASAIAVDDGASGSKFTTLAGFIAYLRSNVGSTIVGYVSNVAGAVARTVQDALRETVSVKDFGAKGDGVVFLNGSITSGSDTLTVSDGLFVPSDSGKLIAVAGAGVAGETLVTTIKSRTSTTVVRLQVAASTTVSGARVIHGTDDTAAIQTAFAQRLKMKGGGLYAPDGNYIVSDWLTVPASARWLFRGESQGGTILTQVTPNKGHLKFTSDGTHSWNVREMSLEWHGQQPATNTNAVGLFFQTGTAGHSFYDWQVQRVTFERGYRSIGVSATNTPLIWGYRVSECSHQNTMTGALVAATSSIGQPRVVIVNNRIDMASVVESGLILYSANNPVILGNEWLNGAAPYKPSEISTSTAVVFEGNRCENYNAGASSATIWRFDQCDVVATGNAVNGLLGSPGVSVFCILADTGSKLTVNGFNGSSSISGGALMPYACGSTGTNTIAYAGGIVTTGAAWTTDLPAQLGASTPMPRVEGDKRQPDYFTLQGDASVTLTGASNRYHICNTTLTANRTITLPSSGVEKGATFKIARHATTPGAFSYTISDPLSGKTAVIPADTNGSVDCIYTGGQYYFVGMGAIGATVAPAGAGGIYDATWFDVTDAAYGATGDGSTDDTAAIQAAINACETAGGGTVYFPRGVYVVNGALQDTSRSNAQILLPRRDYGDTEAITIVLRGECPPSSVVSVTGTTPLQNNLSVIKGTLNTGSGNLIGAQGPVGTADLFTNILLVMRDLTVQMPANPVLTALDLSHVAQVDLDHVQVNAGNFDVSTISAQTTTTSYGIRLPTLNNGALTRLGVVNVVGFYNGYEVGEHTVGINVSAWGCTKGFIFTNAYHSSAFTRLQTVHCIRGIVFTGSHIVTVQEFNIEHAASGTWVNTYDIDDASNFGGGSVNWHTVLAGSGASNVLNVNSAVYLKRSHLYYEGITYALTDGATVTIDCNVSNTFRWTIGGNRTFANPTTPYDGQVINVRITQDGTGSRTWTLGSKFKFPGGSPSLSTTAGAKDFISCQYEASTDTWFCSIMKAMA